MDYLIKRASALSVEDQSLRGITGIPQDWPVEKHPYIDNIPQGFELISDTDLMILIGNNQASYDAWLNALRPIIQAPVAAPEKVIIEALPASASKTFGTKSLFKRVIGIRPELVIGDNIVTWTVPYAWVKFIAAEIIGGELGDYVSLYVLDTVTGTYTTIPNHTMNQFGFTANISKDFYVQKSEFDADLYLNLQIKILFHSISAKTIGINFVMNEVK